MDDLLTGGRNVADQDQVTPESVLTGTGGKFCDYCGEQIDLSGRKRIRVRRFCSDRCRTRWHSRRRQELIEAGLAAIETFKTILQELQPKRRRRQ